MKEYALTINLQDDPAKIEAYKAYHRAVWPEVLQALKTSGITKMEIFLLGRRMFMIMESVDTFVPERDFKRLEESPRYREWQELMNTFQERVPEAKAGEHWAAMEKVFEL
jgi:L-rhamnose mutarotase